MNSSLLKIKGAWNSKKEINYTTFTTIWNPKSRLIIGLKLLLKINASFSKLANILKHNRKIINALGTAKSRPVILRVDLLMIVPATMLKKNSEIRVVYRRVLIIQQN